MTSEPLNPNHMTGFGEPLRFLEPATIRRIDEALRKVGDFGEVRLVVVKGQLRFIQVTQSESLRSSEA